jgi:hypothetical protein
LGVGSWGWIEFEFECGVVGEEERRGITRAKTGVALVSYEGIKATMTESSMPYMRCARVGISGRREQTSTVHLRLSLSCVLSLWLCLVNPTR